MGVFKEVFLLFCGFVVVKGWRRRWIRENVVEIMSFELGFERTKVKVRRIGKEILGRGKEKEFVLRY